MNLGYLLQNQIVLDVFFFFLNNVRMSNLFVFLLPPLAKFVESFCLFVKIFMYAKSGFCMINIRAAIVNLAKICTIVNVHAVPITILQNIASREHKDSSCFDIKEVFQSFYQKDNQKMEICLCNLEATKSF